MEVKESTIDFNILENELQTAIQEDAKYWRENDVKLRAVETVKSYDEFRDLVKAAHLKPLNPKEKQSLFKEQQKKPWNILASKENLENKTVCSKTSNENAIQQTSDSNPITMPEFLKQWKYIDTEDRINLLKDIGVANIGCLFQCEIPVGVLGSVIKILLLTVPSNSEDIVFMVNLLKTFSKTNRFNLCLQFLNNEEKLDCKKLMEELDNHFYNFQMEIAEKGITEEIINDLKKKYTI